MEYASRNGGSPVIRRLLRLDRSTGPLRRQFPHHRATDNLLSTSGYRRSQTVAARSCSTNLHSDLCPPAGNSRQTTPCHSLERRVDAHPPRPAASTSSGATKKMVFSSVMAPRKAEQIHDSCGQRCRLVHVTAVNNVRIASDYRDSIVPGQRNLCPTAHARQIHAI